MQNKVKILIFLAVWQRPEITELCFVGIDRLKANTQDFEIETLAVISEESMISLCEKYNVHHVMHENQPLGQKKNFGLDAARRFNFDYLMEIGSDDLILDELLISYKEPINAGVKFFGIKDAAYIDSEAGYCRRLTSNSTYGAGRMIHRNLLEMVGFKMWKDGISKGMDNNSVFAFMKMGIDYKQVNPLDFPCVIDVKSAVNIWPFNHRIGVEYDIDKIFARLSEKEVSLIKGMYAPA